ncbi:hypothetical protein MNBD_GAMMA18-514 [hydrothermal vent metagenome]|uniref:Uncharacterized protein n=1 Tax=hydrothermal vent metagenome TaxID=652676 RepID=A0A3B0YXE5_9ZZZZ
MVFILKFHENSYNSVKNPAGINDKIVWEFVDSENATCCRRGEGSYVFPRWRLTAIKLSHILLT